ncbi:MAG: hypothetical protein BWY13_00071 [Euryarchaeota archaeon ADurb.Bin190]|nr:MAG: hypothetical protein BWY13_00071 [Euryarchaeota archaeon ADurb.Bin190]
MSRKASFSWGWEELEGKSLSLIFQTSIDDFGWKTIPGSSIPRKRNMLNKMTFAADIPMFFSLFPGRYTSIGNKACARRTGLTAL